MMRSVFDERAMVWLGVVGDLLQRPLTVMPHAEIIDQLRQTFDVTAASFNWAEHLDPSTNRMQAGSRRGIIVEPANTLDPIADLIGAWHRGGSAPQHPLITWHLAVGSPLPYSTARVPDQVVPKRARWEQFELNKMIGCEQQVAINVRLGRNLYHSYVISRSGTDFDDRDLLLARQIQQVMIGLDRQIVTFRRLTASDVGEGTGAGLSPRELSVLSLLAEGLTSQQIARRLQCSPRTVHKHLERTYRKLGVRDRVNAIRVAHQWNLTGAGAEDGSLLRSKDAQL